jgi:hypothetical protein
MDVVSIKAHDEDDPIAARLGRDQPGAAAVPPHQDDPVVPDAGGRLSGRPGARLVCSYQYWDKNAARASTSPCVEADPDRERPLRSVRRLARPGRQRPYFIDMIPMYVKDVKARMKQGARRARPPSRGPWRFYPDATLLKAATSNADIVRMQREAGRVDPRTRRSRASATSRSCGCTATSSRSTARITCLTPSAPRRCSTARSRSSRCTSTASART